MVGTKVYIDHNIPKLTAALTKLIAAGADTYSMMDEIGGELVSSTQERFETGQTPEGQSWQQSESARQRGGLTLVKNTDLVGSITHNPTADTLEVGTNLEYAAIHQFGGVAGRNKSVSLPARPYLGFSTEDETMIADVIQDHIVANAGDLA